MCNLNHNLLFDEIRAGLDLLVSGSIIKKCFTSKAKAKRLSCQLIMDMWKWKKSPLSGEGRMPSKPMCFG